eukprot:11173155-Prorocentrum_lima.AAC.1
MFRHRAKVVVAHLEVKQPVCLGAATKSGAKKTHVETDEWILAQAIKRVAHERAVAPQQAD